MSTKPEIQGIIAELTNGGAKVVETVPPILESNGPRGRILVVAEDYRAAEAAHELGFSALAEEHPATAAKLVHDGIRSDRFERVVLALPGFAAWQDALIDARVSPYRIAIPPVVPWDRSDPDALESAPLFRTPPPVEHALDWLHLADDPAEVILGTLEKGGRILSRGPRFGLLNGETGLGKSRLLLRLAVDLALERETWLGAIPIAPHARGLRTLIVQDENSRARVKDDLMGFRDADASAGSPWTPGDMGRMHARILVTPQDEAFMTFNFAVDRHPEDGKSDCPGADNLAVAVAIHRPGLVILDPLANFYGGQSENDNAQMREFVGRFLGAIRKGANDVGIPHPAIIIAHHAPSGRAAHAKAFDSDGKGHGRGAKALAGAAGAILNVIPHEGEDEARLVFAFAKISDGRRPEPFAVEFEDGGYRHDPAFDMDAFRKELADDKPKKATTATTAPKLRAAMDRIALTMQAVPKGSPMMKADLVKQLMDGGINRSDAYSAIEALEEAGYVAIHKIGKPHTVLWNDKPYR